MKKSGLNTIWLKHGSKLNQRNDETHKGKASTTIYCPSHNAIGCSAESELMHQQNKSTFESTHSSSVTVKGRTTTKRKAKEQPKKKKKKKTTQNKKSSSAHFQLIINHG